MKSKKSKSGSQEYRTNRACELVLEYQSKGWTNTAIANHCNVALSTIRRWFEGSSPNLSTMRNLESIQTLIDREKKIIEHRTKVGMWHQAGGYELANTLDKVVKEMIEENSGDPETPKFKQWLLVKRHVWDGKMLNLISRELK